MHDGFDPASVPVMEFYETNELGGQFDNWVGPNVACLMAMCRSAGFARVRFEGMLDDRAHVSCFRKWDSLAGQPRRHTSPVSRTRPGWTLASRLRKTSMFQRGSPARLRG